jgi:hypothetical protein
MTERGQTQQDFAVGVSVFLLTIMFVFAFVPNVFAPFGGQPNEADTARAERLAVGVLGNITEEGDTNRLNRTKTERFFEHQEDSTDFRRNYTLQSTVQVNVTMEHLDGSKIESMGDVYAGDPYWGRSSASITRIVRLDDQRYRIVVRVF